MTWKPLIAALALFVSSAGAQTLHADDSPRQFVQDFYAWYIPMSAHTRSEDASNIALKKKSSFFSAELLKALQEDALAASKSPGEIVGLDWDPFLNSQEQIERCVIGNITPKNGAFRVDVYDILGGKKDKKPNIIAEVKQENGHWIFVNFWNPDGGNLLSELRELSKSRRNIPNDPMVREGARITDSRQREIQGVAGTIALSSWFATFFRCTLAGHLMLVAGAKFELENLQHL
ncbi:MAG: DUF3828 domain-containing protein [Chthoniobacter sp.]